MRRKDREMTQDFALTIADKCEWATIGMMDQQGHPYCIPVSIARKGMNIYFHSATEGLKIDCLKRSERVCVSCVGDTYRTPDKFTTEYESAIIRGIPVEVTDKDEKIEALRILCQRHTPTNMQHFDEAIDRSLSRTAVFKIMIEEITGKCKKPKVQNNSI